VSRLLFLLPSVPDPADSGAKLRNLMLLRLAAEAHTVDAIAFGQPDQSASLAALAERTQVVAPPPRRTVWQRSGDMARSRLPDMAKRLWSAELAEAVRCLAPEAHLVQVEGIEMARYLSLAPAEKRVYDAHNPEFLLQRRLSEAAPSIPARLYSRMQWQRLERFERAAVRTSSLTLAVSQHDANQLRALADSARVCVVPNGVDAHVYPLRDALAGHDLLFLGKLDYRPNADAVRWLLRAVLPGVFESVPQARLFVVGANPPRWLVEAGQRDARIAVTGYVVDERPYLRRCCALLLPIRIAAGARLKALVAMASGVPIVSTALGMEGLAAVPGTDYVRAESAQEWVHALQRVLAVRDLSQSVARSARAMVEQRYDWQAVRPALRAAYATLRR
jgi:polysaccharide biosynthesis protein PslH